ncbi:hypothetical protein HPP92_025008 [Vanilla planifolia]|uniref:Uncharacterized protein n=1 Tax=Vanilla planifolia TaxID=51239 RepID=A0A835PFU3_VANPL|nr:hypothetical protein HPP92_025008 [Vanilla planifolia]
MEKSFSLTGTSAGVGRSLPNLVSDVLDSVQEAAAGVLSPALPFLDRLKTILLDLRRREAPAPLSVRKALDSLNAVLHQSFALVKKSAGPSIIGMIEESVHDVGRCVGLLLLAWSDAPLETKKEMAALQREMMTAELVPKKRISDLTANAREIVPDVEEVVTMVKKSEQLGAALSELEVLVRDRLVGEEDSETVIHALVNRFGSAENVCRLRIIVLFRRLAELRDENKELIANPETLSNVVNSLSRDVDESKEAVALLLDLANVLKVRQKIGRVQGCITMLITLLNGADPSASHNAGKLLAALSGNTQNILLMSEAGYFIPLVHCLKEGSDMNKVLMATAISRMELTEQMSATLGKDGSIEYLVKMFSSVKMETKLAALNAIKNLSRLKENAERLINLGIISPLFQILFSVTSVLVSLREPASAILESLAKSEVILDKKDVAQQILSVLNLSTPDVQLHLLQTLNSIISHSRAKRIRAKMKQNGAMQILLPFLVNGNDEIRIAALNLLFNLSTYFTEDLIRHLGEDNFSVLVDILSSSTSETEKAAAVGIINNIPVSDKKATQILLKANLLPLLISMCGTMVTASITPTRKWLLESISGVMVRFTVPSDKKLQKVSVAYGIIPCLVKLLSCSSIVTKSRAATSLAQLSQNTLCLSKAKPSNWFCIHPSTERFCKVHDGHCLVKSTFCLLKAGALSPLVQILEGKEREADDAVLNALSTLLQDGIWESGSEAIEQASGVQAIVRVLEVGNLSAQEKAVWMLDRIFRLGAHRSKHGEAAHQLLVDLSHGVPTLEPMIAKILARLQPLEMQTRDL